MKKGTEFFQRSISLIVLFGVLICLPASALSFIPTFETESINFDGTQSSWAEAELKEAYENGLTYDQIENNYQKPITREEFCVIVVKLYEKLGGKAPVMGTSRKSKGRLIYFVQC
jgi:CRISPR/Cas system-associated endoribonuclease Cas2